MDNSDDPVEPADPVPPASEDIDTPITPPDGSMSTPKPEQQDDDILDIGRDAALAQLKTTRKILASERFQERLTPQVNDLVDVPYMPDALEGEALDMAYDLVQEPAVKAIDSLIEDLEG